MSELKRILILTSSTGGGHLSLAEAVRDLLQCDATGMDSIDVVIADPQPRIVHRHYQLATRHARWLWAVEYWALDGPLRAALAHRIYARVLAGSIDALLDATQPDLIVTTYPFLTVEVTEGLRRHGKSIPLVLLIADANSIHATWMSERNAAVVLAPTRETQAQALAAGMPPSQVHLSGWPVRTSFTIAANTSDDHQRRIRSSVGLDPYRFTIFLQGGGEGSGRISHTLTQLLRLPQIATSGQVILAAGSNNALLKRFAGTKYVAVVPFTRSIAPLMSASDVIMGKAGPNTLLEAVALGKPFIASGYIPGQELANLSFIERYQLGWVATDADAQGTLLLRLIDQPELLTSVRRSVAAYRQWNAATAATIAPLLRSLIPGGRSGE